MADNEGPLPATPAKSTATPSSITTPTFTSPTITIPVLTKSQKLVPASLLNQFRATAAVMCYDHVFGSDTMPHQEMQRKVFDMYHGNEEANVLSQVEMMCSGKGAYSSMYHKLQPIITCPDDISVSEGSGSPSLILHPALLGYDGHIQYIPGKNYTADMLKSPTKSMTGEKCSGRFLLDLSKQTVCNLKKVAIIAEEWLVNKYTIGHKLG